MRLPMKMRVGRWVVGVSLLGTFGWLVGVGQGTGSQPDSSTSAALPAPKRQLTVAERDSPRHERSAEGNHSSEVEAVRIREGAVTHAASDSDSGSDPDRGRAAESFDGLKEAVALLRADPVAALEVARGFAASDRRDTVLDQAVAEWGGSDPTTALAWVRQVQPASLRNRLLGNLAMGMATEFPRDAAQCVANEMEMGADQDRAVISVVQRWVKSDPTAVAAWLELFPQTPMQGVAVELLVSAWRPKDTAGFQEWWQGLPEGGFKARVSTASRRLEIRAQLPMGRMEPTEPWTNLP